MPSTTPIKTDHFTLPHPSGEGDLQIHVARPDGLAEGARVPVLFVTDGDMLFGLAAEVARYRAVGGRAPNALVVSIGYGADFQAMAKLRTGDLTPPLSEAGRAALGKMTAFIGEAAGGAEAFLSFLTDTLKPEVLRRCPEADGDKLMLFGHSLGGLFTAYALLTRPHAFAAYLASSPSLWWDGFSVLAHLEGFEARLEGARPRVMIDVGSMEQDLPTETVEGIPMTLEELSAVVVSARMVDAAAEFAAELGRRGVEHLIHVPFQDEDHSSVVPAALMRGLSYALEAWK